VNRTQQVISGGVALLATGAIFSHEIGQAADAIYDAGAWAVQAVENVVAVPSELSHDHDECFVDTNLSTHTGKDGDTVSMHLKDPVARTLSAQAQQVRRQSCAEYVSVIDGLIVFGGGPLALGAGGLALKRRFSGKPKKPAGPSHSSY
jgi:hypothetical protein